MESPVLRITNISSGGGGGDALKKAFISLQEKGLPIDLFNITSEELDNDEGAFQRNLERICQSHLLIVRLHGGIPYFKKFTRLMASLPDPAMPILIQSEIPEEMREHRRLFPFTDQDYGLTVSFLKLGGSENEEGLLLWALRKLAGIEVDVPEPLRPRMEGIYHPQCARDISAQDYRKRIDPKKGTVGLMFYQGYWLSENLQGVDGLIGKLESQGMNVIPVFFTATPDPISGALGTKGSIERYFWDDGEPIIDVLIMTMGFSQLRLSSPGDGTEQSVQNFFDELNVPVLQASFTYTSHDQWVESIQGLGSFEMSGNITWPEYDGQIITVPVASMDPTPDGSKKLRCIESRAERVASMAKAWIELKNTPPSERKLALILYQNPPRRDTIGGAFGLDVPESIVAFLKSLQESGYHIDRLPKSGKEIVDELLAGLANDDDWLSAEQMMERAAGTVSKQQYGDWTKNVPSASFQKICRDWGQPPGELFTNDGSILIPGVVNGNVFIGIQPPRGMLDKVDDMYHSTDMVVPHNYLAYYRWLQNDFGAQAVVHLGTHGTLEWLPGKSMGLSESCYPDIVLGEMLNLYPYLMSNPGEGMQAKRRSYAVVVDHLPPAMTRAGNYGDLEALDVDLQAFLQATQGGQEGKKRALLEKIAERARSCSLLSDLGLPDSTAPMELEAHIGRLYDYLSEVKDALIKDGLHVLGRAPQDRLLDEMVYSLTRLRNGTVPSLRDAMADARGLDLNRLRDHPAEYNPEHHCSNAALLDEIDESCTALIGILRDHGFRTDAAIRHIDEHFTGHPMLQTVCSYICQSIVPGIAGADMELINSLRCLDGGYVPPGPSGVPTRGNAHLLPSGRNFYSIDPASIPTPASWEVGRIMADQMIDRHVNENGKYPESVGMVVFATDTMKTGGDDIAYILWLMGLRPLWSTDGGKVTGIEVIPIDELERPRIDVTLRISGLFRDTFPHLVDLIDQGVEMISSLDESPQKNFICKHLDEEILESIRKGLGEKEARSKAKVRVFGCPPGTYGGGVGELIESSKWTDVSDLGKTFVNWGCYAYGGGRKGERSEELFEERLSRIDVTVKNHCSRELDMLDNDDDFVYHGGMIAAVRSNKGSAPSSFVGDSSNPENTRLRSTAEESKFIFRSRVMNPKWLEGLMRHGYRGVQELASLVDYSFAWDATADIIEPWMYQTMAERFLFDQNVQEWINENNPYAMRHMTGRLLEAVDRNMWAPDSETKNKLESLYLDSDEFLEGDEDQ